MNECEESTTYENPSALYFRNYPLFQYYIQNTKTEEVYAKPASDKMRMILQWWGTEFRRSQDPDYWVKYVHCKIHHLRSLNSNNIVVSDVRFPNEANLIKNLGGMIWKTERPGNKSENDPISESFCIISDVTLHNDSTLYELALKTKNILTLHTHANTMQSL